MVRRPVAICTLAALVACDDGELNVRARARGDAGPEGGSGTGDATGGVPTGGFTGGAFDPLGGGLGAAPTVGGGVMPPG
ncbi:ABC transporter ATP-binding protein, partial [Myxococcota bacterium]|nr:ABC transporter ATP-binding protein [Myxococcota bacterium]